MVRLFTVLGQIAGDKQDLVARRHHLVDGGIQYRRTLDPRLAILGDGLIKGALAWRATQHRLIEDMHITDHPDLYRMNGWLIGRVIRLTSCQTQRQCHRRSHMPTHYLNPYLCCK